MTDYRSDLEYWTDATVSHQKAMDDCWKKLVPHLYAADTYDAALEMRDLLLAQSANIHWLDQTVNHYPTSPKKFWQFWK